MVKTHKFAFGLILGSGIQLQLNITCDAPGPIFEYITLFPVCRRYIHPNIFISKYFLLTNFRLRRGGWGKLLLLYFCFQRSDGEEEDPECYIFTLCLQKRKGINVLIFILFYESYHFVFIALLLSCRILQCGGGAIV